MARTIELLLTLLQLGPIFVLSIGPKLLSPRVTPKSRQARAVVPEIANPTS